MNLNPGDIAGLIAELGRIEAYLNTLLHPNLVLAKILQDTVGMLLNVWFGFVLTTTDVEPGDHVFTHNVTITSFEPKVQMIADAGLVLIAMWSAYRIMWGTASSRSTRPASFSRACSWPRFSSTLRCRSTRWSSTHQTSLPRSPTA